MNSLFEEVEWRSAGVEIYNLLLRNSKVKLLMEEAAAVNHSTHQTSQPLNQLLQ